MWKRLGWPHIVGQNSELSQTTQVIMSGTRNIDPLISLGAVLGLFVFQFSLRKWPTGCIANKHPPGVIAWLLFLLCSSSS